MSGILSEINHVVLLGWRAQGLCRTRVINSRSAGTNTSTLVQAGVFARFRAEKPRNFPDLAGAEKYPSDARKFALRCIFFVRGMAGPSADRELGAVGGESVPESRGQMTPERGEEVPHRTAGLVSGLQPGGERCSARKVTGGTWRICSGRRCGSGSPSRRRAPRHWAPPPVKACLRVASAAADRWRPAPCPIARQAHARSAPPRS